MSCKISACFRLLGKHFECITQPWWFLNSVTAMWRRPDRKKKVPSSRSGLKLEDIWTHSHFYILYSGLSVIEDVEAGTNKSRHVWKICLSSIFISLNSKFISFHFNTQKREEKFVPFLLFFACNFIRTRTDGGGDISSTHFVLFRTTCSHCVHSFCCKWGGTSTKKKKCPP